MSSPGVTYVTLDINPSPTVVFQNCSINWNLILFGGSDAAPKGKRFPPHHARIVCGEKVNCRNAARETALGHSPPNSNLSNILHNIKRACCIILQHALILCRCLHLQDVGAVSDRPRAIINRPYKFYRRFCVFYNRPFFLF